MIKFPFKDDFFGFIRNWHEEQAVNCVARRLTFVCLGVAAPYDLIADKHRTPFGIGRAIALEGFQLSEISPLLPGLTEIASNPQAVLQEVLAWTSGQPFLIQKLCSLIVDAAQFIPAQQETEAVAAIVRSQILQHWEDHDHPEHLKTIRDRLLWDEKHNIQLLGLYQQILEQQSIPADNSNAQLLLRLSGVAVRRSGCLCPYNQIYQTIFDLRWVKQELDRLRPYAHALNAWLASERRDQSALLQGEALQQALAWANDKALSLVDQQFLAASQRSLALHQSLRRQRRRILQTLGVVLAGLAGLASTTGWVMGLRLRISSNPALSPAPTDYFSVGERLMLPDAASAIKKAGVAAIAKADYRQAAHDFAIALKTIPMIQKA
ncbi:MAG: hypothetical protein HC772_13060 [Leptolyngbyaceae cyanobacterium CRU_2_3]|nr:hypothetical protein [Leptolyngbyaceae cyanobacterium CRU_2_3]